MMTIMMMLVSLASCFGDYLEMKDLPEEGFL